MRRLKLGQTFALAICPINTFMHMLTRKDQEAMLACAFQHLTSGGLLVMDVISPYPLLLATAGESMTLERELTVPDTGAVIHKFISTRFDHANQIQNLLLVYDEIAVDHTVLRTAIPVKLRYAFRFEIELLLEHVGFTVENIYGSVDLEPYGMNSDQMIVVARK
jgi:hypothetical protein